MLLNSTVTRKWNITSVDTFNANLNNKGVLSENQIIQHLSTDPSPLTRYMSPNVSLTPLGIQDIEFGFYGRVLYVYMDKSVGIDVAVYGNSPIIVPKIQILSLEGDDAGLIGITFRNHHNFAVTGQLVVLGDDTDISGSSSST